MESQGNSSGKHRWPATVKVESQSLLDFLLIAASDRLQIECGWPSQKHLNVMYVTICIDCGLGKDGQLEGAEPTVLNHVEETMRARGSALNSLMITLKSTRKTQSE